MEQKTNLVSMSAADAWADFSVKYNSLPPGERGRMGLKSEIDLANRDAAGKRMRTSGTAYGLGAKRVAGILATAWKQRPDVFPYEGVEVVEGLKWVK